MENLSKKFIKIIAICVILIALCTSIVMASVQTVQVNPTDNQYFELKAVEIKNTSSSKQVIMELWGYDIQFKGLDVRFKYDNNKLQPSDFDTNEVTEDETEYFKFEKEFQDSLDILAFSDENIIEGIISFNPPVEESEHIIEKDGVGKLVDTTGGVLLGKMSFQLNVDEFDISGFSLVSDEEYSPNTGIKINIDGLTYFDNQSTFRFTDATASKDAYLTNIIVSSGEENELEPDKSTYKEYSLTPTFEKDSTNYELELLEYIDKLNIKITQSDTKSIVKVKVPKRDDDDKLIYDSGGQITYEEKDIENDVPFEVLINKLGEPDTNITITVTAEDTTTVKEYTLIVKRPYGTIKGSIYTSTTYSTGIYKSNIKIYKSEDVNKIIDWKTVQSGNTDDVHEKLLTLNSENYVTNDDGTYEIYVIPGQYDVLLDKAGYLDHIYTAKEVNAQDTIDLGYKELIAGDINKDGCIQILDLSELMSVFGIDNTNSDYNTKYDFNEDSQVQILDLSIIMANFSEARIIE